MRTRAWPLFILLFLFKTSFAQTSGKSIKLYGHGYSLAVNKNKQLAIATNNGEVAFANAANGVWRKTFVKANADGTPGDKAIVEDICYFNADTAFVWGSLYNNNNEVNDRIYLTINRGKSWRPVKLGFEGKVSDAIYHDNGEAWLNLEEKGIAYTKDYGVTWTRLSVPFPNLARRMLYTTIFFNNKGAGIVGSPWNVLAYTTDNCKNYTIITTPYSQEYPKNKNMNPVVNRVAIYKSYLLVKQCNSVYYSKIDTVNWIPLPEYKDFYTDPESKALFFERSNGGFVKSDSTLKPVASFESIKDPYSAVCRNGNLYVLGKGKLWQVNNRNQLVESGLNFIASSRPVCFGHTNYPGAISHVGNKIFLAKNGHWVYAFTLPFATDSGFLYMKDGNTILFSRYDSIFYYHIENGKVDKGKRDERFYRFGANGIKAITFERSSWSCYRSSGDVVAYERKDSQYVLAGRYEKPYEFPDTLNRQIVEEFIRKIPALYSKQMRIEELEFTEAEYDSCKRNILELKAKYEGAGKRQEDERYPFTFDNVDPDFTKLISIVDSVKTINRELLNCYFFTQKNYSPVTHSVKITFEDINGDKLEFGMPDFWLVHFHSPWEMKLNGSYSITTAIEINRFINNTYPGFLRTRGRVNFMQELVKYIYFKTR